MKEHLKQIDALRCYAVLSVMFLHLYPANYFRIDFLSTLYSYAPGVPLFFCISGFLITGILSNNSQLISRKELFKSFYLRRILRIFPIYYLTIIVLFIFIKDYNSWVLYDLFYLNNIKQGLSGEFSGSIAPHFWSLSVEEQFYIFWPLLLTLSTRFSYQLSASIFITLLGIITMQISGFSFLISKTIGCLSYLGMGACLSFFWSYYKDKLRANHLWLKVTIMVFFSWFLIQSFFKIIIPDVAYFYLGIIFIPLITLKFSIGFRNDLFKLFFENPVVLYLGKISYGLYIFHFISLFPLTIILKTLSLDLSNSPMNAFICKMAITILISSLSWEFFEKRILKLKNKFEYVKD